MEEADKEACRKKWAHLTENILLQGTFIKDHLIQDGILSDENCERVEVEKTKSDQVRRLLRILLCSGPGAFKCFIKALKKSGYGYIAEELLKEKKKVLKLIETFIPSCCQWIKENVKLQSGGSSEVSFILNEIHKADASELSDDCRTQLVLAEINKQFPSAVIQGSSEKIVRGVSLKSSCSGDDGMSSDVTQHTAGKPMKDWTKDEVCNWLTTLDDIDEDAVNVFRTQKIRGRVLWCTSLADMRDVLLNLPAGDLLLIMQYRDEHLQNEEAKASVPIEPMSETKPTEMDQPDETTHDMKEEDNEVSVCRKFGTDEKWRVYRQGTVLSCEEERPEGKLKTVHNFCLLPKIANAKEKMQFISYVLKFICAYLNERQNATVHVGVVGREDNGKDGNISGTLIEEPEEQQKLQKMLIDYVMKCFPDDQVDIVLSCVSNIRFIPVTSQPDSKQYVLEIDITASFKMCGDESFFVKLPTVTKKKKALSKNMLFRINTGVLKEVSGDELRHYVGQREKIVNERKSEEESHQMARNTESSITPNLCFKLKDLLYLSDDQLPDTYRLFVVNKPCGDKASTETKNLQFIKHLEFKSTFDFDASSTILDFLCDEELEDLKIVASADEFDDEIVRLDEVKALQENIKNSAEQSWICVKGLRENENLNLREWKMKRQQGFREAVRFYRREIPKGRALVVFLVLSEDEIMLEAAEHLIEAFPNQWMAIIEDQDIASRWQMKLMQRQLIDERTWSSNTVIGMPLDHISGTVKGMQGPMNAQKSALITTTGAMIATPESLKKKLSDLEILFANQCDDSELTSDVDMLAEFRDKEEQKFYKGGQCTWWNFWFGQVLGRTKLGDLKKHITKALKGGLEFEERHVGRITLYHQAGAGGTTLARNALWDFKEDYRCAIIQNFDDHKRVAQQILELRAFGEQENPLPVLIMLDNVDPERANILLAELEEKAKHLLRDGYWSTQSEKSVICVLLKCQRHNDLPTGLHSKKVILKHNLDRKEKVWFEKKLKEMEKNHEGKKGWHPEMLLSFNIMKENFRDEFIQQMVKKLVSDIGSSDTTTRNFGAKEELTLLKFIALMNSNDVHTQALPTAAFDAFMTQKQWQSGVVQCGFKGKQAYWEAQLSTTFKILVIDTSIVKMGHINAFKISPLLSRHVLQEVVKFEGGNQTTSEIVVQLLTTSEIVSERSSAQEELLQILKNIFKQRARNPDGSPETDFSPIIQQIVDNESIEQAGDVLEKAFSLTHDPFIAQQLARLYIHSSNWEKAEHFAMEATDMIEENSFLWDTYGRVFLKQLEECRDSLSQSVSGKLISASEAKPFLALALSGMEKTLTAQKVSESERHHFSWNTAGYFTELEIITALLECLAYVKELSETKVRRKFLVDPAFQLKAMSDLDDPAVKMYTVSLKKLQCRVEEITIKLEDSYIQLREETFDETRIKSQKRNHERLQKLKDKLNCNFTEMSENPPSDMSEEEKCEYRRRYLRRFGQSMMAIFDIGREKNGKENLVQMCKVLIKNIGSDFETAEDLQIFICVGMALLQTCNEHDDMICLEEIIAMSQRLFVKRGTLRLKQLEPYLFFTMFNWPGRYTTEENVTSGITNQRIFEDALKGWKDTFFEKYPRQKRQDRAYEKETKIFFFSNLPGNRSIISYRELRKVVQAQGDGEFWNIVRDKLARFNGTLCKDGSEVKMGVVYPSGNKYEINIPTSFPLKDRLLWHKKVTFALGFGFSGPKVFDVMVDDQSEIRPSLTFVAPTMEERKEKSESSKVSLPLPVTHTTSPRPDTAPACATASTESKAIDGPPLSYSTVLRRRVTTDGTSSQEHQPSSASVNRSTQGSKNKCRRDKKKKRP